MQCGNCGAEMEENAARCGACGQPLKPAQSEPVESPAASRTSLLSALAVGVGVLALFLALRALLTTPRNEDHGIDAIFFAVVTIVFTLAGGLAIVLLRGQLRGRGLTRLGLWLGVAALVLGFAARHKIPVHSVRSKVARVKADMRALAIALEEYYQEHNAYPAWSADPALSAFGPVARQHPALAHLPSVRMRGNSNLATLTTPVAYVNRWFGDPFAPTRRSGEAPFCYWTPPRGTGYIIWSPGPDLQYDLTMENVLQAYAPEDKFPSPVLLECTFDPSNGVFSSGDIYRIKE